MGKRGRRKGKGKAPVPPVQHMTQFNEEGQSANITQILSEAREQVAKNWMLQQTKEEFLHAINSIYNDYDSVDYKDFRCAYKNWQAGLTPSGKPIISEGELARLEARANEFFLFDLNNELLHIVYNNLDHYITQLSIELLALPLGVLLSQSKLALEYVLEKAKLTNLLSHRLLRTIASSHANDICFYSNQMFCDKVMTTRKFKDACCELDSSDELARWVSFVVENTEFEEPAVLPDFETDFESEVECLKSKLEMTKRHPHPVKPNLRADWLESLLTR